MDLSITACVAFTLFVSFLSAVLMKKFYHRKTFDEVIAEKKAMVDKMYGTTSKKGRTSQNVKKEAKKDKKRQQKLLQQQQDSDGQQSETPSESADSDLKPHIEFEPEPVILEEEPAQDLPKQKKLKKTDKKQGILMNKNEIVCKENDSPPPNNTLNNFEVNQPKDAVELKRQLVKEVVKEVKPQQQQPLIIQQQSNESPKNFPKKKADKKEKKEKDFPKIDEDIQGVNGLIKLFSNADLNRSEIQLLIDFLLNKQQDMPEIHSSWSDDIVPKLRKELELARNELLEERSSAKSIQEKLHLLRIEYNCYKSKYNDLNKKYVENLEYRETQVSNLQQEIDKLAAERQQFQAALQHHREKANSSQDLQAQLQSVTEKNNELQADVINKDREISRFDEQLIVAHDAMKELNEVNQSQYEQISRLKQEISDLTSDLSRLQETEAEKKSNKVEIRNLQNALDSTKSELSLTYKKLEEASEEKVKNTSAGEETARMLKDELKEANEQLAQISTEKVQISKTLNDKYSKLEQDHNDLIKQQESYKDEVQNYKQIVSEKDNIINNFEKNSKQREEIILQLAEQKEKNNVSLLFFFQFALYICFALYIFKYFG